MADFMTHHLFGKQVLTVFPASVQEIIENYPACFYWGCQGPDPLFFRKILLGSPLHALGSRMHNEKTDELFSALLQGVRSLSDTAHNIAAAYFFGFLCHYALDSTIHPYVYFRQEQICSADSRLSASAVHCQIESNIDCLLYERLYHKPATTFEPSAYYLLEPEEKAVISALLHIVLRRVYGETVSPRNLRRSFDEALSWQTFFYSDAPRVYRSACRIEKCIGRGALLTGHMKTDSPAWDALNEQHTPWQNLWNVQETRTESVLDLLILARIYAASLAGQYAAQIESNWQLHQHFAVPFSNGKPGSSR